MKKLATVFMSALLALNLSAQENNDKVGAEAKSDSPKVQEKTYSTVWPAFVAVSEFPRSPDIVGIRLTIPFSTVQDNITGIDLGFWGHSMYFEGLQFNLIRNDVVDSSSGFQFGIYNSVGRGEMLGLQVGLWNEAYSMRGVQAGLVNVLGEGQGFQVGVINRAETLYGYQVGLINVIRSAELSFMPLINVGF